MVEASLADLVGGEMLFPGETDLDADRERRIVDLERMFQDGISAMRRGAYGEAKACFDALMLVFTVATSIHGEQEQSAAQAQEREGASGRTS